MSGEEEAEAGLLYPFVVCESNGGIYNDAAFVAGCTFGDIARQMAGTLADELSFYVPPALVPQLDLAAMHHGWTMTSEPWDEHPDEWALVELIRSEPTP